MAQAATVHASAALVGARAILIRGPAASGKSRLAWALIEAAEAGRLRFARLIADDRVALEACHGRLLARAPRALEGLIEVRALGIRRIAYEPTAVVGLVVDLAAPDAERLPGQAIRETVVEGIRLPRLAVASGQDPLPAVLAALRTADAEPVPVGEK
jgi:HPr kinase/phosphorylase